MIKHVYIHIPFCKYICTYCDFCKKYIKNQPVSEYLNALEAEISKSITEPIVIDTLYIGGGTPSALNEDDLDKLASILAKYFCFNKDYEFTFECNPDDVSANLVPKLKQMGVNRVSMGVQTLNDELLTNLSRKHSAIDVQKAIDLLKPVIANVSCDFIFNLPEQRIEDIIKTFEFIKTNKLKHVSYYGLILEENTILDTKEYELQSVETEVEWYSEIQKFFESNGYVQYEISNFAKEGYESRHNYAYWQQREYYGFGLGASGYVEKCRYTNTKSLNEYLKQENIVTEENQLVQDDLDYEKIFLNLRTSKGIELEFINELKLEYDLKFFEIVDGYLRIRKEYFYESNEHIVDLLMQLDEE